MMDRSTVARCARNAALVAALAAVLCTAANVLRGLRERNSAVPAHTWFAAGGLAALLFAVLFALLFSYNLVSAARAQPAIDILNELTLEGELLSRPLDGFVAMEFYWGISNRTFLVMVAPEGLYGWKVTGPITNADRRFFEPYQEMLKDPGFPRDLPVIRKLAGLRGGFIYPRSEVVAVTSDDRRQWGMGGIPHAGHVQLRFTSGMTRKFILLGEVIPEEVRDRIVATLGAEITSLV